jgi:hypothetical protein
MNQYVHTRPWEKATGKNVPQIYPPRIIPARWSNDFIRKILQINLMAWSSTFLFAALTLSFSEK